MEYFILLYLIFLKKRKIKLFLKAMNSGFILHKEILTGHTRFQLGENNSGFLKWICEKTFHTFHRACKVIDKTSLPKENPWCEKASKGSKVSRLSPTAVYEGICSAE